jgi:predicted porin
VDYKFTDRTKLYSYYTYSKLDQADALGINDDLEANVVGMIGLELKF